MPNACDLCVKLTMWAERFVVSVFQAQLRSSRLHQFLQEKKMVNTAKLRYEKYFKHGANNIEFLNVCIT